VVYPHDEYGRYAPPERAHFVNISVDVFKHGTLESVPVDYPDDQWKNAIAWPPQVLVAEANNPPTVFYPYPGFEPQKTTYTLNGQTFPRWVYNGIPVEPGFQYHFAISLGMRSRPPSVKGYSNVWTYASDAHVPQPIPQLPPACIE
jgi:hypothetical protein